jgi:hypothetical protein
LTDKRYTLFQIGDLQVTRVIYHDPDRTNWEFHWEDLKANLGLVPRVIHFMWNVQLAVNMVNQAILSSYHQNCPAKVALFPTKLPWGRKQMGCLKAGVFNPRPACDPPNVFVQPPNKFLILSVTCFTQICALLGYNAESSSNPLPVFQDNVSVPSSRVKKSKKSRKLARETHGLCRERHGQRQLSGCRTANGDAPAWEREGVST